MDRVSIPPVLVVRGEAVDHNGYGEGEYLYDPAEEYCGLNN